MMGKRTYMSKGDGHTVDAAFSSCESRTTRLLFEETNNVLLY